MADDWTEEQIKEFIIKDNVNFGEWDNDLLKDWDTNILNEWGVDIEEKKENINSEIQQIQINPFTKTHILLSFKPELFIEIQDLIQKIKDIEGIEYEQSSN